MPASRGRMVEVHRQFRLLTVFLLILLTETSVSEPLFKWHGRTWYKREGKAQGPGPNDWLSSNVRLVGGARGILELTISCVRGRWQAAEIYTTNTVKYGTYAFYVEGRPDQWHKNYVLGMFTYPVDSRLDGKYEIDVELTRWGDATNDAWINYAVFGSNGSVWGTQSSSSLQGSYMTHWFTWKPGYVKFGSEHGHQKKLGKPKSSGFYMFSALRKHKTVPDLKKPCQLHINLWRFEPAACKPGNLTVRIHKVAIF